MFYPLLALDIDDYDIKNFDKDLKTLINKQIKNHKVSQVAHEEITTMIHSDEDVAEYFYQRELALSEKVHVMMHLIPLAILSVPSLK